MAKREAKRREEEMKANLGKSDKSNSNNAYTLPVQAQVPTVQEILNNSQTGSLPSYYVEEQRGVSVQPIMFNF